MQISVVKINKENYHSIEKSKQKLGQQGFTLIEILMAIFLIFVVVSIIPLTTGGNNRSKLEESLKKIERAIRFATNESILRNKIIRLKFNLQEIPMSYSIEYGQSANLVLPEAIDLEKLSLSDREAETKKMKKIDSQFIPIPEFEADNEPLPEAVSIYALGTTYYPELMKDGILYVYFYPSGEKDSSILFLYTAEEMVYLKIFPFEERTSKEFIIFNEFQLEDIESTLEAKSKELFEQWLKN